MRSEESFPDVFSHPRIKWLALIFQIYFRESENESVFSGSEKHVGRNDAEDE